ncbi:hypothetical protein FN3523_0077 [Francisella hispaniensis]|uniref:Uncharacterized protein n=1 Tax=Francisella hispaniensis TaxID=622488 RepID=F4BIE0_9GAMM|nr:hypothetical protein FN3523_0077 [Francisella hispaniensis]
MNLARIFTKKISLSKTLSERPQGLKCLIKNHAEENKIKK